MMGRQGDRPSLAFPWAEFLSPFEASDPPIVLVLVLVLVLDF
jgi:hypothetical protein